MSTNEKPGSTSVFSEALKGLSKDKIAVVGFSGILFFLIAAVFAPFIANGQPLLLLRGGGLSSPALHFIFAPDSPERVVEKVFNYILLSFPVIIIYVIFAGGAWKLKMRWGLVTVLALLSIPFFIVGTRIDKTDWRAEESKLGEGEFALFAPIPYGPFENVTEPYRKPSLYHIFGTDQIGRDIFSRMIYGARVSLAVGIGATGISMTIGIIIGLISGYYGGKIDLSLMRVVEVVICFPTFLLLLILMSIMMDRSFGQSILIVIGIIGLTSWTGLSRIVRGEVLQQRQMPYIRSCESLGLSTSRILFLHLLPNVAGPVFVSFTFGIAGAILAESGLSFLGFGVQPPTASWGELLRQAFADPVTYWHLTLWPGLAIFASVISFNFAGEGLRKILDPKA